MSWTSGNTIVANRLEDKNDRNQASGYPQLGSDAMIPFNLLPTGLVIPYAGAAAPSGWMLCDGSAIDRTTYSALYALTSTSYGVGNGSTTFNIPNLLGRVVVGAGAGSGLTSRIRGTMSGSETHIISIAEMPAHAHSGGTTIVTNRTNDSGGEPHPFTANTGSVGSSTAHQNMIPFGVATYIIKT